MIATTIRGRARSSSSPSAARPANGRMMDAFRLPLEAGLVGVTVAADAGAAPLAALNLAGLALALLFGRRALRLLRPAAVAALVSSQRFCRAIIRHKAPPMSRFPRDHPCWMLLPPRSEG